MRKLILVLVLFVVASLVFSRSSNAEIYTTVSGRVTAEDTGKGIVGVTVTIFGGRGDKRAGAMVKTNEEGRYIIKDVLSGIHYLSFYPSENSPYVEDSTRRIEVLRGKHLTNVNQILKLGGGISGTVYDSDGKTPVSGLKITADCPMASGDDSVGRFADTDSNGQYIMRGFDESDKCTVKIMQPSHYNMERVVSVKKGQTTKVDFIMRWNDITGISGVVTGADNQPIEGALIALTIPFKALAATAFTDTTGRYTIFGVPPGTYEAMAASSLIYSIKQNVVIEKDKSTEVNFTLLRKQSNLSWVEKFLAFIKVSNAYAYPSPMPEPQVPFDIQPSCFALGQVNALTAAIQDLMRRTVAATPADMGPAIKVRIAQKLKEGIKIECEQSKNNRFCMFGSVIDPIEAYASTHIPASTIHMCPATYTDPLGLQRWASVLLHETVHASNNAKIGPGWPYKDLASEKIPYECEKSLYCEVPISSSTATGCCCR